jgi:short-subunit dehydrogenase
MKEFMNKTAWITGGSSGIGLELAKRLAGLGANIVIMARNEKMLEKAAAEISEHKISHSQIINFISMDVSDEQNVISASAKAAADFGNPDILIVSAGIAGAGRFEDMPSSEFDRVMKVNVSGARYVIASAIPYMKKGGGHIVILSSLAGLVTMYGYSAYGASKYALVGMAEALRAELRIYGIKVSVVCPPEVTTPFMLNEAGRLPAEGRAVKLMAGQLSVEDAASKIMEGIRKDKFFIIPGAMARFSWYSKRFLPAPLMHFVTDIVSRLAALRTRN